MVEKYSNTFIKTYPNKLQIAVTELALQHKIQIGVTLQRYLKLFGSNLYKIWAQTDLRKIWGTLIDMWIQKILKTFI